jgi:starch synthase (maltosyl-transferring)
MLGAITIDDVRPRTPSGAFPAKAVIGAPVVVSADIFRDGHDVLGARVRWRPVGTKDWKDAPLVPIGNDRWEGELEVDVVGMHELTIEAWTDRFATWRRDVQLKVGAGDDVTIELEEGAILLEALAKRAPKASRQRVIEAAAGLRAETCSLDVRLNAGLDDDVARVVAPIPDQHLTRVKASKLWVDRRRAVTGAWYELFPRSEGGLAGAAKRLVAIADMGFDVVYLPPIHPIGTTARKGPGNTLVAGPDDPGSPWAIGSPEGGHTAIHSELGTFDDFARFLREAGDHGLEVALDYALQCSPDHPWVTEHPEWFHHRPDGTIKYAENPPKKYQDIYPINFWPDDDVDRKALWQACRDILLFWIAKGIRIFRVDNPHTKPMAFWAWVIEAVQAEHPDVLFLAEAFTRPKVMAKLAEIGFTQSYTYFTWRTAKWELEEYVTELTTPPLVDYMRPSFWPNTPDILSGPLRGGPPEAFALRYVLAATLVPAYGVYSGYELYENEPAADTNEEYAASEKFESKERDWNRADSLAPLFTKVNEIRRRHPVFSDLRDVRFHDVDNEQVMAYSRGHADRDLVLVVVNLDPVNVQEATVHLDLAAIGLPGGRYTALDELTGDTFSWEGPANYVRLDPSTGQVAHILSLRA